LQFGEKEREDLDEDLDFSAVENGFVSLETLTFLFSDYHRGIFLETSLF